MNKVHINSLCS